LGREGGKIGNITPIEHVLGDRPAAAGGASRPAMRVSGYRTGRVGAVIGENPDGWAK